jgi:hypothetical protein
VRTDGHAPSGRGLIPARLHDQPQRAQRLAVVELDVDRAALVADPAHAGDYVLERCPPEWVHRVELYDVREQVPPADEVREFATLMRTARALERDWQGWR